jgi:hypothetical protein
MSRYYHRGRKVYGVTRKVTYSDPTGEFKGYSPRDIETLLRTRDHEMTPNEIAQARDFSNEFLVNPDLVYIVWWWHSYHRTRLLISLRFRDA